MHRHARHFFAIAAFVGRQHAQRLGPLNRRYRVGPYRPSRPYQLLSQISEVPLANVVDANYSVVAKARKSLLPVADAFGGLHRDLRERAARIS